MKNPWLQIPAWEYEGHMASPEVGQAQVLNELFASALAECCPDSLAVLGCATGNGFEHIDPTQTKRVDAVDINPEYLEILKTRFGDRIPCLDVIEADFTAPAFQIAPVSMVFAGLIFEYVPLRDALRNIERCMAREATLVALLQLPSAESAPVTESSYESLKLLTPAMSLVPPDAFAAAAECVGLQELRTDTIPLRKGKAFSVGRYRKAASAKALSVSPRAGRPHVRMP